LDWLLQLSKEERESLTKESTLRTFGNYLGRVTSYRALSLREDDFKVIQTNNTIWPSGRLKTTEENISKIIKIKGVKFIAYARLYIGLGLLPYDPSLSLHDDPETALFLKIIQLIVLIKIRYVLLRDI